MLRVYHTTLVFFLFPYFLCLIDHSLLLILRITCCLKNNQVTIQTRYKLQLQHTYCRYFAVPDFGSGDNDIMELPYVRYEFLLAAWRVFGQ
jgi:hypothetical protein